jgi:flagellar biogenesis protein FliO
MLGPKGNIIRLLSQLAASLALLGYVIWVVVIIWS